MLVGYSNSVTVTCISGISPNSQTAIKTFTVTQTAYDCSTKLTLVSATPSSTINYVNSGTQVNVLTGNSFFSNTDTTNCPHTCTFLASDCGSTYSAG